jgi:hypothetical protein
MKPQFSLPSAYSGRFLGLLLASEDGGDVFLRAKRTHNSENCASRLKNLEFIGMHK